MTKPKLSELKYLKICIEFLGRSINDEYFRNLNVLSIDAWLSIVNEKTLKSLILDCGYIGNDKKILQDLTNSEHKLNLTMLKLRMYEIYGSVIDLLSDFLKSQKNLQSFDIRAYSASIKFLYDDFADVLECLDHLKILDFGFCKIIHEDSVNSIKKWKLNNLNVLRSCLISKANSSTPYVLDADILFNGSESIQILDLTGFWNFKFFGLEEITLKFPNLRSLTVREGGWNYSINDVIYILLNLKDLKILDFSFPQHQRDNTRFDQPSLTLPKIETAVLGLNKYFSSELFHKLQHLFNNGYITDNQNKLQLAHIDKKFSNTKVMTAEMIKAMGYDQPEINSFIKKVRENPETLKFNVENMFDEKSIKFLGGQELSDDSN